VEDGRLIGVVTERELLQLAVHMLQQGVATGQLTEIVSTLNDALTRRLIVLERARLLSTGAVADALATAQSLQVALARDMSEGMGRYADLRRIDEDQGWLERTQGKCGSSLRSSGKVDEMRGITMCGANTTI
jgi:hypothetical protein